MISSDFVSILDVSAFVWDKDDYASNTHKYFSLLNNLSALLVKLQDANTVFLLRSELLNEMVSSFPYEKLPHELWASGNQIYHFLGSIGSRIVEYDKSGTFIESIPNLFKTHFKDNTNKELLSLLGFMHREPNPKNTFFSLTYLYEGDDNLLTRMGDDQNEEHATLIVDSISEVDEFISQFKLIFEHHTKHDPSPYNDLAAWRASEDKDNFPSQLSCYDRSLSDPKRRPQELLDNKFDKSYGNDYFYSYDDDNGVYVVFRITKDNIYHAYDMYDIQRVPNEVKAHFNIWKY